jgi:hypothetical protein
VCPSLVAAPQARVIDPQTLEVPATYNMPNAPDPPGTKAYQNFSGGGYFYLDRRNRIWSATKTSHIFVLQVSDDGITFVAHATMTEVAEGWGASGVPDTATHVRARALLPDNAGLIEAALRPNQVFRNGFD